ncbi:hypothetical protein HC723_12570 [Vibrio sp. S11_S32]|uniref:hypothetical protein n=1 Tax=Vibrio sp. S11_S32 TaxID=2720225 RepID=UPI001680C2C0|nr:hypothetical protein [Vibrio sp. S11_S32]MBD1577263.1 hypothetical protein [Vibrio sp. S11_S32]
MRQGWYALILCCLIGVGSPFANAVSISREESQQWLQQPQLHEIVTNLYALAMSDDAQSLNSQLNTLSMPNQEIARFLLLKKLEQNQVVLGIKTATFVQAQTQHTAIYNIEETGDGYQTTIPAFNASIIATRLMQQRTHTQSNFDFILAAEDNNLPLDQWLQGSSAQVAQRESLLISAIDSLSPQALSYLVEQIAGAKVVQWLPSSAVMAKMAQASQDPRMYHLLWRMKSNTDAEKEVQRLAKVGDTFSTQQLILATDNPALKSTAMRALVKIKPMPMTLEQFFVAQLNQVEDQDWMQELLVSAGHADWVQQLINSGLIPMTQTVSP